MNRSFHRFLGWIDRSAPDPCDPSATELSGYSCSHLGSAMQSRWMCSLADGFVEQNTRDSSWFFTCPAAGERVRWKLFFRINCHLTGLGFWQCFKFRSVHTVWSRGPWMQMECRNHWCDQRRRQGCPMEIIYVDPSLNNQNHPRCVIRYYAQPPKNKYQYIYYYSIFICSNM